MIGDSRVTIINKQNGAASLFVVIITTLVVVIITVGFVRQMISDQQQATVNDLSQSAFDSAQAGVEDAKRAILRYENLCNVGTATDCTNAYNAVTSSECNSANSQLTDITPLYNATTKEVKVQTGSSNSLDQAYTCVKILLDTNDFVGELKQDNSKMIPLIGVNDFDTVKIEWFNSEDLQDPSKTIEPSLSTSTTAFPLLAQDSWITASQPNRPSIMRAQLLEYNNLGFEISTNPIDESKDLNFNSKDSVTNKYNSINSTLFLYPSTTITPIGGFTTIRRQASQPVNAKCKDNLEYACYSTLTLPMSVKKGERNAFLNLKALYRKSHFRVTLFDSVTSTYVGFHEVQPEIDSTGRANDLYRRVSARVELGDITFPFPEAAVDISGDFCKNFYVTDNTADYWNDSSCTP